MSAPHDAHVFPTYNRAKLRFERGEGVRLYTEDGTSYLDLASGIAVNALGHAHPRLVEAVNEQAAKLWHTSNLYEVPGQERLADRLCAMTFADRAFFTNSGAEALEVAIKTARRYHYERGDVERVDIVTFTGAFHGRTLATVTAGGNPKYTEGFGPALPGFVNLPFGDHDALKAAIEAPTTAAILVEPVQGEGGVRPVPHQCLRGLRALCDEHGVLLIYDEVQCGVGRTGKMFAYEWAEHETEGSAAPDIMGVAKGIGGGFPVGVCLAREDVAQAMQPGTHGTTYGGNPLAMAVANAVLDVMEEPGFLDHVQARATQMRQGLARLVDTFPQLLEEFRGDGLLLGLKVREGVAHTDIAGAFREERMLSVPAGMNVVRLLPPLTITEDEVREALDTMERALAKTRVPEPA